MSEQINKRDDNFDMLADAVYATVQEYLLDGSTYAAMSTEIMTSQDNDIGVEKLYILVVNETSYECLSKVLPVMHHDVTRRIFYEVLHETVERLKNQHDLLDNPGDV